jgi:hypothetical protein
MPKGIPISEEHKARMAAGRAESRARKLEAPVEEPDEAQPIVLKAEVEDDIFDGMLTEAEKLELREAAIKKARDDQKKAAKAAYAKEQLEIARRAIGEMPLDEEQRRFNEEEVRLYVDMPRLRKPDGRGEHAPEPIIIDQKAYVSGRYYTMKRGEAVYVQWLMDQARRHVAQVDGRSRSYYDAQMHQVVHMGGVAAGGGMLGPGFDAIHKRAN